MKTNQQDIDTPDFECAAFKRQIDDWTIVSDCFQGTSRLREAGDTYLPQHPAEGRDSYNTRLAVAVFWNAFKRTIKGLVGMVFRKPPVLSNDVPETIRQHWENIDFRGTHGDVFANDLFNDALRDGHVFIFVEMAPPLTDDQGNVRQAVTAPETAQRRPYWIKITKDQVVNWRTEQNANGQPVLVQATIKELVIEPDGLFGEVEVTQFRVLRPGSWEIWREKSVGKETVTAKVEEGVTTLEFIPLAVVYTNRTDFFESTPPLIDQAHENLRHYRLQSDLDHVLHVANVPIKTLSGGNQETQVIIGPDSVVRLPEGAELKYVEHQGNAIEKAQEEIEKSKRNMATLGLSLLMDKSKTQTTATEIIVDDEAQSSELSSMAQGVQDGIEQALIFHAAYLALPQGGSVEINREFRKFVLTPEKIARYSDMVARDQMSLELMLETLARASEFPDDFNLQQELERVAKAKKERADLGAEVLRGFDQDQPPGMVQ